jgi:hypothetical protein
VSIEILSEQKQRLCRSTSCIAANACIAQRAFRKINESAISKKERITELRYNYGQALSRNCINAEKIKPDIV